MSERYEDRHRIHPMWQGCTPACETLVECAVCGKTKEPRGRSVSPEMAMGLCDWECEGYLAEPRPPHLFPGELRRLRVGWLAEVLNEAYGFEHDQDTDTDAAERMLDLLREAGVALG